MSSTNSRLKPLRIAGHSRKKFGSLNPLQREVVSQLTETAERENFIITKGAVNYLLREIEDPSSTQDITDAEAQDVLQRLLEATSQDAQEFQPEATIRGDRRTEYTLLSYSTLRNTLRVFRCPKPWC